MQAVDIPDLVPFTPKSSEPEKPAWTNWRRRSIRGALVRSHKQLRSAIRAWVTAGLTTIRWTTGVVDDVEVYGVEFRSETEHLRIFVGSPYVRFRPSLVRKTILEMKPAPAVTVDGLTPGEMEPFQAPTFQYAGNPRSKGPAWYGSRQAVRKSLQEALGKKGRTVTDLDHLFQDKLKKADVRVEEKASAARDQLVEQLQKMTPRMAREAALAQVETNAALGDMRRSVQVEVYTETLASALVKCGVHHEKAKELAESWRPFAFGG